MTSLDDGWEFGNFLTEFSAIFTDWFTYLHLRSGTTTGNGVTGLNSITFLELMPYIIEIVGCRTQLPRICSVNPLENTIQVNPQLAVHTIPSNSLYSKWLYTMTLIIFHSLLIEYTSDFWSIDYRFFGWNVWEGT